MSADSIMPSAALLRRDAGVGQAKAQAAQGGLSSAGPEFEAILLQQVVRAMRATVPESGLLGRTTGQEVYDHLIETALSEHMAQAGGIGIAELFADEPAIDRPIMNPQAGSQAMGVHSGSAARTGDTLGVGRDPAAPPLSAQIPPQDDAWLDSPQVVETLRRSLLSGQADPQVIEKTSEVGLRRSKGPPVAPIERDL